MVLKLPSSVQYSLVFVLYWSGEELYTFKSSPVTVLFIVGVICLGFWFVKFTFHHLYNREGRKGKAGTVIYQAALWLEKKTAYLNIFK